MKHWIILGVVGVALSGCGNANWHSIDRSFSPSTGESRLIDAKQRAIISIVNSQNAYKGTCAEPSPDALQATAAALSGSGSLSKDEITAALNLAASTTESAASIGLRTQSIQLLRDAYYRICEGYLNGGLDEVSYDVLQRRFQNHMIALLAVEQLTGVVKAEQVALTSQSAADAGAQLGVLMAELRKQREELNELKKRDQALANEIAELEAEIKALGTPKEDEADKKKQLEEKQANLEAKKSDKTTLQTLIADQEKAVAALQSAVEEASRKTINAQSQTTATRIGGGDGSIRSQTMNSEVAKAVSEITLAAINSDYTAQICTETTRTRKGKQPAQNSTFQQFCNSVLKQIVDARYSVTAAVIEIEKGKTEACKALADAARALVGKMKKDITVQEASTVLKDIAVAQSCYESLGSQMLGGPISLSPGTKGAETPGGTTTQ